jgi:crotonobetainyl-CoA:carnitine CoA-transferase CaiB-like acyl-CoA transferase
VGVAIIDLLTAHAAVQQILSALLERESTGKGRRLDVAMVDAAVGSLTYMAQNVRATGVAPGRMGSRHPSIAPYQAFRAKDGWFVAAVGSPAIWKRFCPAIGRPELLEDPEFRDNACRVEHRERLESLLSSLFATRPLADWVSLLTEHDVPAAPVNDLRAALELPTRPPQVRRAPPRLGEHSDEILRELGEDAAGIARLRERGVL